MSHLSHFSVLHFKISSLEEGEVVDVNKLNPRTGAGARIRTLPTRGPNVALAKIYASGTLPIFAITQEALEKALPLVPQATREKNQECLQRLYQFFQEKETHVVTIPSPLAPNVPADVSVMPQAVVESKIPSTSVESKVSATPKSRAKLSNLVQPSTSVESKIPSTSVESKIPSTSVESKIPSTSVESKIPSTSKPRAKLPNLVQPLTSAVSGKPSASKAGAKLPNLVQPPAPFGVPSKGPKARARVEKESKVPTSEVPTLQEETSTPAEIDIFDFEQYPDDYRLLSSYFQGLELYLRLACWIQYKYQYLQNNEQDITQLMEHVHNAPDTALILEEYCNLFVAYDMLHAWYVHFSPDRADEETVTRVYDRYKHHIGELFNRLYKKYVDPDAQRVSLWFE